MQEVIQRFSETIRKAAAERTHVRIRGSGAKDFYGLALIGEVLDTRACSGIVEYEPTELVLTARAGTPLVEVEAELAKNGQMLAFEPPHFGPAATLGGAVACGFIGVSVRVPRSRRPCGRAGTRPCSSLRRSCPSPRSARRPRPPATTREHQRVKGIGDS